MTTSQVVNDVSSVRLRGLVDAVVDHLRRQIGVLAANLADAVEDHDGVVDRIADQGQEGGHRGQIDLEILQPKELADERVVEEMAGGDGPQREEQVVDQADDGGQAEGPVAEAEPEVERGSPPSSR